jgi:hypothetical protein
MKPLFLSLTMLVSSAYAQVPIDYKQCSQNQQRVVKSVTNFHYNKAKELLKRSAAIKEDDDESLERKKLLFRLAHESFVKNLALAKVTDSLQEDTAIAESLTSFVAAYENSIKVKLYLSNATESFQDWAKTYKLNSQSFHSLSTDLKTEIIERVLKSFSNDFLSQLTDEELFILGLTTDIGVKATMYIGGRIITAKAIGTITGSMLFEWAGGPIGIMMIVAPIFTSGTLPLETKWTDIIEEYPQLLLDPNQMIKAKLAKNSDEAMYLHCLTWQRRQKTMNHLNQQLLKSIDDQIEKTIAAVRKKYHNIELDRREGIAKQDNTFVKKPILQNLKKR